jgi:hypothetical protein
MRRFAGAVALAVVTAGCFGAPGSPDSLDIEIPDAVVRGEPGSVHVLKTVPVAPQAAGRVCAVAAQGINNESVHPNSDLLVRSDASEVVIFDVERAPNVRTDATGPLTLGSEISVAVRLGPDEVFSGGLVVEIDCAAGPTSVTFNFTGTVQTFTVPAGVSQITVDAFGAQGGGGGGLGGRATATFSVTPGETLQVTVGGQGLDIGFGTGSGGFNGGGSGGGGFGQTTAPGGGGASDVRRGAAGFDARVVVAGGGGGRAEGGAGGGTTGGAGNAGAAQGGGGGTQSAGGAGGAGGLFNGSPGTLGGGGSGAPFPGVPGATSGGGGGGGLFGGGGGAGGAPGAGGGGSGFTLDGTGLVSGVRTGNGLVTITTAR